MENNQNEFYKPCSMDHGNRRNNFANFNPNDMHWHIKKSSFNSWALNCVYFALHAIEIYLIIRLVK
jgi:hypothetical protein